MVKVWINKSHGIVVGSILLFLASMVNIYSQRLNLNALDKSAAPEVIKCVQDAKGLDADYRAKCVDLLGEWKEQSAISAIEGVLSSDTGEGGKDYNGSFVLNRDRNGKVRIAACYALREMKSSGSIPVLAKTLKDDMNYQVRVAAAAVLADFEVEAAVDGLIDALLLEIQKDAKADMPVVRQIVRSLSRIGHKKAFIPLLKATQVSFPDNIKEDAQQAIENIRWDKDFKSSDTK